MSPFAIKLAPLVGHEHRFQEWRHRGRGPKARLFVNGASQLCLIVNDLRLGGRRGKIALWARISSDAYFSNLRVEAK